MQFLNMLAVRFNINIKNGNVAGIELLQAGKLEEFASSKILLIQHKLIFEPRQVADFTWIRLTLLP